QGAQKVGMGKKLYDESTVARHVFQMVDDAINQPLSKLMFEGPQEELTLTENAQPALMATSLGVLKTLEERSGQNIEHFADYCAGHSLGEYSALAASRALNLSDCARLLKARGCAMQAAVPVGKGAMAAILGIDIVALETIIDDIATKSDLVIANDNSPGQIVISGTALAVKKAVEACKATGAKRAFMLDVSAPFHSPLMAPASEKMRTILEQTKISNPVIPLICNVQAKAVSDCDQIRDLLIRQVCARVEWRKSMHFFQQQNGTNATELGAGKVLSGLMRKNAPSITTHNLENIEDIDLFLQP
ncbi:MAG: ACP S-malonyltransferase, partial [Pseudomonadota bacterium]